MTEFRLIVEDGQQPFVLITEPLGREIFLNPGETVDVSCDDDIPELVVLGDGRMAIRGNSVVVTDSSGVERVY
jgi:hypothetical protein